MPEQERDGDSTHTLCIDDEKHEALERIPEDIAKTHKVRRRSKRKKGVSSSVQQHTKAARDVDTEDMSSIEPVQSEVLHEEFLEAVVPDTPLPEEVLVPETPMQQSIDGSTDGSVEEAGRPLRSPLHIDEHEQPVGETLAVSQMVETATETPVDTSSLVVEEILAAHAIADTPLPPSVEEIQEVLPSKAVVPTTPSPTEDLSVVPTGQKHPRLSGRTLLTYALFTLLFTSTLFLWQDLTATHVYMHTIDALSGSIQAQQDLGGYRDAVHLTVPVSAPNDNVVLGVYSNDAQNTQQLLTFHETASTLFLQHSTPLANGAITRAVHGYVLVEDAHGMQVVAADGHVVWRVQGEQPTRGVHSFQPVSDAEAVYTIQSVRQAQVAAYDLVSGHTRWVQRLNDTLNYAPPFLLDGGTLYVASDHNVFALNSNDGTVRWEKPYAFRTLLLDNESHILVALGAQGIQALQSNTGEVIWSFRGNSNESDIPTQFYQGCIGSVSGTHDNVIYATGVVWHMPDVREYVWLYAIDATTGQARWSKKIASGLAGVDAGRVLQPLLNTDNGIVVVQHAERSDERSVTAFNAGTGAQRWNKEITAIKASSASVFSISSKHTFVLFTTTTNSNRLLWTPSPGRIGMMLMLLMSCIGLFWLLFLSRTRGIRQLLGIVHAVRVRFPLKRSRRQYIYAVSILALLVLCVIGIDIYLFIRPVQPARQLLTTDAQGSVVLSSSDDTIHQLEALDSQGTSRWKLFSSEGMFSVPKAQAESGTLLVALSGHVPGHYLVAEDDPAYARPLDSMFALYLLDRRTGRILWQHIVSYPDEHQDAEVIGADPIYIYVVGEHTLALTTQENAGAKPVKILQLFAVNKATGTIDWRVFDPSQSDTQQRVHSTLHLGHGQVFWQVAGSTFTIDTSVGQIIARQTD